MGHMFYVKSSSAKAAVIFRRVEKYSKPMRWKSTGASENSKYECLRIILLTAQWCEDCLLLLDTGPDSVSKADYSPELGWGVILDIQSKAVNL